MIRAAGTLTSRIPVIAVVHTVGGCCGAFIERNSLGIFGGIWLLAVATDTRPVKSTLKVYQ